MRNFSVKYHDGRLSVAHDATLTLMPDHWLIHYVDPSEELVSVRWQITPIVTDESFTGLLIFRYGEFPQQTIECREASLPGALKETYPGKAFFRNKMTGFLRNSSSAIIGIGVLVIALFAAAYWFLLPVAAEAVAARIPSGVEARLGNTMYDSMIASYEVDEEMTDRANAFVKEIDFKTHYPIRVTVVKENEVNAFALPGGNIIVFDRIIASMKTKEEFAALLAHEVAHVHFRHSLRNILRNLGGFLFVSLLLNDINGIVTVLADNSNMLANLTYSRALETEADQKAMTVLQSDGISLKGFVDLFKLLQSAHGDVSGLQLLSTHPLTQDRLELAKTKAREQVGIKDQSALQKRWRELVNLK